MSALINSLIEQASPRIAVIFSGRQPRLIGTVAALPESASAARPVVDDLLISQSLSADRISIAESGGTKFLLAHR